MSTKTKEVEVWVETEDINKFINSGNKDCRLEVYKNKDQTSSYRVKVALLLPERKIEISESAFDEAVSEFMLGWGEGVAKRIKEKLFGEGEKA